jgi:glutathione-regulated potassium-efflux system ancillary protein KefG
MSKVLILFAHPSQNRSEINILLYNASNIEGVTLVDLYNEYPNYRINIQREQSRLAEHDIIVFMFPLYWYSTPAILKEWQDLVLEYGFAYGHDGKALQGKKFFCATTAGGPENAYQSDGMNHYSINELLQPLEQMASLCNMQYLPPFVLFGARTAREENRVELHINQWEALLKNIIDDRFDYESANKNRLMNHISNVETDK